MIHSAQNKSTEKQGSSATLRYKKLARLCILQIGEVADEFLYLKVALDPHKKETIYDHIL